MKNCACVGDYCEHICEFDVCCRQAASSVHCTISCKHSLVLLRMGEIISPNMLS